MDCSWNGLDTVVYPGAEGFARMQSIMQRLRETPPKQIDGIDVTAVLDYQTLERRDVATGDVSAIDCIKGNVLTFECGNPRCRVTIRPSGTEPKLKFYTMWYFDTDDAKAEYAAGQAKLEAISRHLEGIALED